MLLDLYPIVISPNGALVAGQAPGATDVQIWDTATGRPVCTLEGKNAAINLGRFSLDGKCLIVSYNNHADRSNVKVFLWDTATGKQLVAFDAEKSPMYASQHLLAFGALAVALVWGGYTLICGRPAVGKPGWIAIIVGVIVCIVTLILWLTFGSFWHWGFAAAAAVVLTSGKVE